MHLSSYVIFLISLSVISVQDSFDSTCTKSFYLKSAQESVRNQVGSPSCCTRLSLHTEIAASKGENLVPDAETSEPGHYTSFAVGAECVYEHLKLTGCCPLSSSRHTDTIRNFFCSTMYCIKYSGIDTKSTSIV